MKVILFFKILKLDPLGIEKEKIFNFMWGLFWIKLKLGYDILSTLVVLNLYKIRA